MEFEYRFSMSKDEARERLEALTDYLANRHGLKPSWNGDTASVTGRYTVVKIDGRMALSEGVLKFSGKDPGMLWRKKAEKYLRGKLDTYLNPATAVADLPRG